jgi:hypothetical protein
MIFEMRMRSLKPCNAARCGAYRRKPMSSSIYKRCIACAIAWWDNAQAAAGNGIFVVGDRRPETCLRDETCMQRHKSRPHDREKAGRKWAFPQAGLHGEFRWTGWWAHQGSNLGPCVYRKLKLGRSGGEVRQGWRVI